MVRIRGVRCALASDGHLLKGDGVFITNPKHVEFARKRRKDFRPENRVCAECAKFFIHVYDMKLKSAKEKKRQASLTVSSSSSLDDFDRIVYQTPRTKHLRDFVKQSAPYNLGGPSQELSENVEEENQAHNDNAGNSSYGSNEQHSLMVSDDSSVNSIANVNAPSPGTHEIATDSSDNSQELIKVVRPTASAATTATNEIRIERNYNVAVQEVAGEVVAHISDNTQNVSQTIAPINNTTTTASNVVRSKTNNKGQDEHITADATVWRKPTQPAKRKRVHIAPEPPNKHFASNVTAPNASNKRISQVSANTSTTSDEDFDDYQPSLNALNGTRLPHIQPIPKRRHFQHAIPTVQDIYMQGITGG
ncbi:uncharacterized protein LOC105210296 [Zeugodacus cucurbitae]|uniref:Uncharacterized protein n=1 Tax=Zeugodacus cucurbitae TaxID=28588 RepID=A0A0A1WNY4_ZEUCU|nr:uncharacterized protein LOC105210296 [Zeugodacus cucurbitae]